MMNAQQTPAGHVHRRSYALANSDRVPCPGLCTETPSSASVRMDIPTNGTLPMTFTGVETIASAITPPTFVIPVSLPSPFRPACSRWQSLRTFFPGCPQVSFLYQIPESSASPTCKSALLRRQTDRIPRGYGYPAEPAHRRKRPPDCRASTRPKGYRPPGPPDGKSSSGH